MIASDLFLTFHQTSKAKRQKRKKKKTKTRKRTRTLSSGSSRLPELANGGNDTTPLLPKLLPGCHIFI
jgi:hypothetical protein